MSAAGAKTKCLVGQLGDLCDISIGRTPARNRRDYWGPGSPWLSIADMNQGRDLNVTAETITDVAVRECNCRLVPAGTVLLSFKLSIGKVGITARPLFTNEAIAALPIKDASKLLPEFLYWSLRSIDLTLGLDRAAKGLTLNSDKLHRIRIPLPPLPEQRRIAETLNKADALRAKRCTALAQLDTLTQSIFLDMFGDPATNPKGWPVMPFRDLGTNQDALRVPVKASDRDAKKGEFAYYGASGIIDWVDDFIFEGERLLIGEDGANLVTRATPVAFVARGKYWVNNHAHVIAENGLCDLRFLEFFVARTDLKPFLSGTAQPKLNRGNLDRIPVPTPPIQLQREFARRVGAVEALKAEQHRGVAVTETLFATLQHNAFPGQPSA